MKTLTEEFKVQDVVTAASVGSGGLEVLIVTEYNGLDGKCFL